MSKSKTEFFVRLRLYDDTPSAMVWLLERTGLAEQCLLHGYLRREKAEALCAGLESQGLRVEREQMQYGLPEEEPTEPGLFTQRAEGDEG